MSIIDRLTGRGSHEVRWHFHLAPGVDAAVAGPGLVQLSAGRGLTWRLQFPEDLAASIVEAAYSPSYGVKTPCLAVETAARVTLAGTATWTFSFTS